MCIVGGGEGVGVGAGSHHSSDVGVVVGDGVGIGAGSHQSSDVGVGGLGVGDIARLQVPSTLQVPLQHSAWSLHSSSSAMHVHTIT